MSDTAVIKSPLFRDPIQDGAADPTVIWNRGEQAWWMFYTNRRATNAPQDGTIAWVTGTPIGVASSTDGAATWLYRGTVAGLDLEWGQHTYWAPEIFDDGETYHMYVTVERGVPSTWVVSPRRIRHYTSPDLISWTYQSDLPLPTDNAIDACVHPLPGGGYRLWYKDEEHGSHTYYCDSDDLYTWKPVGPAVTARAHEGPNVFEFEGRYWMVVDEWQGQRVLSSEDLATWRPENLILDIPGTGTDDAMIGQHADVVVTGGAATIFYFTHPERRPGEPFDDDNIGERRTSIHAARLRVLDGVLTCDRNEILTAPLLPIEGPGATPGATR
ncbi:MAG TPA: hypothetical protein VL551_20185 [Actinospica sp.]|jgi:hypothetical protein|nr:hypothetical protein [Actinospica sp.]